MEVEHSSFEEKYLGLPTPEGRMKASRFQPTKERFIKRLTDWSEKYMSMGAKDELIKSVAQALTTYVMGVFKMPARSGNSGGEKMTTKGKCTGLHGIP
jgi:hypothetical protein